MYENKLDHFESRIILSSNVESEAEGSEAMRFHMTYEGPLYGSNSGSPKAKHKHEIRKVFHKQIKRLWGASWLKEEIFGAWPETPQISATTPLAEGLAQIYQRGKYHFVPLVRERVSLLCSLDILFLRSDVPGSIIGSGDIDNRLKTLFDALRMPSGDAEMSTYASGPDSDEEPFYCLLEDDKLISNISVKTDMLLEPIRGDVSDSRLIIDVRVSHYRPMLANIGFGS